MGKLRYCRTYIDGGSAEDGTRRAECSSAGEVTAAVGEAEIGTVYQVRGFYLLQVRLRPLP